MHATLLGNGAVVDVSIHEALATLAITELARAGQTGKSWSRKRVGDGNGATVCILQASDGYVAISPREDRQWASWLEVMASPGWGQEPRFATKKDRIANWDALHALMVAWSRDKPKHWIAEAAQGAHVPSFPLCEPGEHIASPQLRHREFFRPVAGGGRTVHMPGSPFGLRLHRGDPAGLTKGPLPLSGVRVLDFSWVIAGPTATRYLAAMGAEVMKIEAPGPGDPGRASELHSVLGQAKKSIVLDLKKPEGVALAKALAAKTDVLIENFATGVMDRLGLGAEALHAAAPNLIYISASGLGRTGPEAHAVAYGTLLQCYAGFAGLNRHPGVPPRVGMAWLDPMCGLMLAFITAASVWRRRTGAVARVDFSMIEAMLWTMAEPLLQEQLPAPQHQAAEGAVFRCAGLDEWISFERAPESPPDESDANTSAWRLTRSGIAAAALARSADLVSSEHLRARGFWDEDGLPSLPWLASFGRATGPAPGLGADADAVLGDVLGWQRMRSHVCGTLALSADSKAPAHDVRLLRFRGSGLCRARQGTAKLRAPSTYTSVAGCIGADGEGHSGIHRSVHYSGSVSLVTITRLTSSINDNHKVDKYTRCDTARVVEEEQSRVHLETITPAKNWFARLRRCRQYTFTGPPTAV
jgi:crotonobetainyl-CoA:carnitine CoA-transferase CaiB-like acyl-CoA transferase